MNYSNRGIRKKQKEINSATKKANTKILTYVFKIFITFIVVLAILGASVGFGAIKGIVDTAPEITLNDVTPSLYKTTVYDCKGVAIETLVASGANRIYVTYNEIPKNLVNAFVSIEDERFWEHNGIDAKGIMRALYLAVSSSFRTTQGASTITQQLIKNSVFSDYMAENSLSDNIRRKIQEQYLALGLEEKASKEQILENYLNTINLGNNNLGVQSAAVNYFNKDVSTLTLSECAVIAAITQNPSRYNPVRFPEENDKRRRTVLKNMLDQNYISWAEYSEALEDDVYERIMNLHSSTSSSAYDYYTDAMIQQLMTDLMEQKGYTYTQAYNLVYRGGLSIYSCEDSSMQKYAQTVINDPERWNNYMKYSISVRFQVRDANGTLSSYSEYTFQTYMQGIYGKDFDLVFESKEEADTYIEEYKNHILEETGGNIVDGSLNVTYTEQPQCSFVAIDNATGEVRVLIGGRGDKTQSLVLNRATTSERQAGSTIKPLLVYAPAIDIAGYGTGTVINDIPYYWDTGALVRNDDRQYAGYCTVRKALAESRNIPAIKALDDIGIMTGISYLNKFGLSTITPNDYYLPTAIGTCSVTNYEITAAYSVFANGGNYIKPKLYTKVLFHDGTTLLDNTAAKSTRVIKESTAWLVTEALHSVTTEGTISGSFYKEPLYIACKSGTSQNWVDKWVVGYGGDYSCGIWTGFDTNEPYDYATYGYGYIDIWKHLLYYVNGGEENAHSEPKPMPSNIVAVEVCADSGLLPVEGLCDCDPRGSRIRTEYFEIGTEPTAFCKTHVEVTYCVESGDIASPECYHIHERTEDETDVDGHLLENEPTSGAEGDTEAGSNPYLMTVIRILQEIDDVDLTDENTWVKDSPYAITKKMLEYGCRLHGTTYPEEETTEEETKKPDSIIIQ